MTSDILYYHSCLTHDQHIFTKESATNSYHNSKHVGILDYDKYIKLLLMDYIKRTCTYTVENIGSILDLPRVRYFSRTLQDTKVK